MCLWTSLLLRLLSTNLKQNHQKMILCCTTHLANIPISFTGVPRPHEEVLLWPRCSTQLDGVKVKSCYSWTTVMFITQGEKKKLKLRNWPDWIFLFFFNPCNLFLWLATNRAHQKNFLIQRTTNYTRGLAVRHLAAFKPGRRWRWQYAPTHLLPTLHD